MFTQTLSDLTLDWSKVRSDKLLCVNTAVDVYVRLDLVLQDVASTVKRTAGALQRLTDDSNFICESSKRKTIFKDMCVSGKAFCTLKRILSSKNNCHTRIGNIERPQHTMNLQEHERQVCTIKDGIGAVCFFYFEQIGSIVSV